jgi:hypothetical protein
MGKSKEDVFSTALVNIKFVGSTLLDVLSILLLDIFGCQQVVKPFVGLDK